MLHWQEATLLLSAFCFLPSNAITTSRQSTSTSHSTTSSEASTTYSAVSVFPSSSTMASSTFTTSMSSGTSTLTVTTHTTTARAASSTATTSSATKLASTSSSANSGFLSSTLLRISTTTGILEETNEQVSPTSSSVDASSSTPVLSTTSSGPTEASSFPSTSFTSTSSSTSTVWRQELLAGIGGNLVAVINLTVAQQMASQMRIRAAADECGAAGASIMHEAVQPAWTPGTGTLPLPTGPPASTDGAEVTWEAIRIVRPGNYRLCVCEASCVDAEDCCSSDEDFAFDNGQVAVAGPTWMTDLVVLGHSFQLQPSWLGPYPDATLRMWRFDSAGFTCGQSRSAEDQRASEVLPVEDELEGALFDVRVFRKGSYYLCWCPGDRDLHGTCSFDSTFVAEVGMFHAYGPHTENLDPIEAVVGSPFSIVLGGDLLSVADRVRIFDFEVECGTVDALDSLAMSRYVCPRDEDCVTSPVGGAPNDVRDSINAGGESFGHGLAPVRQEQQETWEPVVLTIPGTYRLCWCVDLGWDPVFAESDGHCLDSYQFAVPVGLVHVQGVNQSAYHRCPAFGSCHWRMFSPSETLSGDGVLLLPQTALSSAICGRGAVGYAMSAEDVGEITEANSTEETFFATFRITPDAGPPGTYQLCYCSSAVMGPCTVAEAYAQPAGILEIVMEQPDWVPVPLRPVYESDGPQLCNMGVACSIFVEGMWAVQLQSTDVFRAVPSGVACDDPLLGREAQTVNFFLSRKRVDEETGLWEARFTRSVGLAAGDYTLCYCGTEGLSGCIVPDDAPEDVGILHVVGATRSSAWLCAQGQSCTVSVPAWRADELAVLLVVDFTTECRPTILASEDPEDGFDDNPAYFPAVEGDGPGVRLDFDLGTVHNAGRFRACLCIYNVSASRCSSFSEYKQDAGVLTVAGPLSAVDLQPSDPPTATMVSIRVIVERTTMVRCAVADDPMTSVPTMTNIMRCFDQIPGCLGSIASEDRLAPGAHTMHIELAWGGTEAGATVRAWCTADVAECPTRRCVLPPSGEGMEIDVTDGVLVGKTWFGVVQQTVDIVVEGNPLNSNGGDGMELRPASDTGACGETSDEVVYISRPSQVTGQQAATWRAVLDDPGSYRVCWCDRTADDICILWHYLGDLHISGPSSMLVQAPSMVTVDYNFILTLPGVNLSSGLLVWSEGDDCNARISDTELSADEGMLHEDASSSEWSITAPSMEGNFTLCWGQGGVLSSAVLQLSTIEPGDCLLSDWLPANQGGCSRTCGGGEQLLRRTVLSEPRGGGTVCPPAEELEAVFACGEAECPEAVPLRAWTEPDSLETGETFQVVVEGLFLDPSEDHIQLVPLELACGNTSEVGSNLSVPEGPAVRAACVSPNSSTSLLVCGALSVQWSGAFRVCLCDATYAILNGSVEDVDRCVSDDAYALQPLEGFSINVSAAAVTTTNTSTSPTMATTSRSQVIDSGTDEDDEDTVPLPTLPMAQEDEGYPMETKIILGLVLALLAYAAVSFCVWWRCLRRQKRRCCFGGVEDPDEEGKDEALEEGSAIVRQATQEVWNAFARTMHEAALEEAADVAEREGASNGLIAIEDDPAARYEDQFDIDAIPPTPPTGRTARSCTPKGSRNMTPESNATLRTEVSHKSFVRMHLPQQGPVAAPPSQTGGSFLDLPLLGKHAAQDGTASATGGGLLNKLPSLQSSQPVTRDGLIKGPPTQAPAPPPDMPVLHGSTDVDGSNSTLLGGVTALRSMEATTPVGPTPPTPPAAEVTDNEGEDGFEHCSKPSYPLDCLGPGGFQPLPVPEPPEATLAGQSESGDSGSSQSVDTTPGQSKGLVALGSSILQRLKRPFSAGRPTSAGLASRARSMLLGSPQGSSASQVADAGTRSGGGRESPRCCPDCGRRLVWSDFALGTYDCGWNCNFIESCGQSGAADVWRWFCKECRNDFCGECYFRLQPSTPPHLQHQPLGIGETAVEAAQLLADPQDVEAAQLPWQPQTAVKSKDPRVTQASLPRSEDHLNAPFTRPAMLQIPKEPPTSSATSSSDEDSHSNDDAESRLGRDVPQGQEPSEFKAAEPGRTTPATTDATDDASAHEEEVAEGAALSGVAMAGPAESTVAEDPPLWHSPRSPGSPRPHSALTRPRRRDGTQDNVLAATQSPTQRNDPHSQTANEESREEEHLAAQMRLQADWNVRLRADAWRDHSTSVPEKANSTSLSKVAETSRHALPSAIQSAAPSQLQSPRDTEPEGVRSPNESGVAMPIASPAGMAPGPCLAGMGPPLPGPPLHGPGPPLTTEAAQGLRSGGLSTSLRHAAAVGHAAQSLQPEASRLHRANTSMSKASAKSGGSRFTRPPPAKPAGRPLGPAPEGVPKAPSWAFAPP